MLWAKREEKDIIIQELQEATRFVSYQECHNALGNPSVQVLSQAMNDLYLDSYLIPKPPKNFHCSACLLSKSTRQMPGTSYERAENSFELIYTDLSGKFNIRSIGKDNTTSALLMIRFGIHGLPSSRKNRTRHRQFKASSPRSTYSTTPGSKDSEAIMVASTSTQPCRSTSVTKG